MKIELLQKEIDDKFIRENFFRIKRFVEMLRILDGNWEFFEIDLPVAGSLIPIRHGLGFAPKDVILTSVKGDYGVYFNHEQFDSTNLYVTARGPCRIRFLAGNFTDAAYGASKTEYPFVAP